MSLTTRLHPDLQTRKNGVPLNPEDYLPATIDELMRDLSRQRQGALAPAAARRPSEKRTD